jgi:hypothetical protein
VSNRRDKYAPTFPDPRRRAAGAADCVRPDRSGQTAATIPPTVAPLTSTAAPEPGQALIGTWATTVTTYDLLRVVPDFDPGALCDNAGAFVWQFKPDGTFLQSQTRPQDGCWQPANTSVEDTWTSQGETMIIAPGRPEEEAYTWSVVGDRLTFTYQSGDCIPCLAINTANP